MIKGLTLAAMLPALIVAGCSSVPDAGGTSTLGYAMPKAVTICHGYGCYYSSKLFLGAEDGEKLRALMEPGAASPEAERDAIKAADRYFEERAYQVTGVRDQPKSDFGAGRVKGQMDCVDESTNTETLLTYLSEQGLLRHHTVRKRTSRGMLIDGRYPHWTAVIRDPAGVDWAVDSWYATMGGAPDVIPLSEWKPRGFLGSGAVDA